MRHGDYALLHGRRRLASGASLGEVMASLLRALGPMPVRLEAWRRLARDLDRRKLAAMTQTIPFEEVFEAGRRILKGETRGRLVVTIG